MKYAELRSIKQQPQIRSYQSFITDRSYLLKANRNRSSVKSSHTWTPTLCIRWKREIVNLQKIRARKVDSTVRQERVALYQQLYEAEADVEARMWKRRNSDFPLQEVNQEFESQMFSVTPNKSMGRSGSERESKSACKENWNWDRGSSKTSMQETAEKLRNWKESVLWRKWAKKKSNKWRINCLCNNSGTLRQEPTKNDCEIRSTGCAEQKLFVRCTRFVRSWIRFPLWSCPRSRSNFYLIATPGPCRAATLELRSDTLNGWWSQERIWTTTCTRSSSTTFNNSINLASSQGSRLCMSHMRTVLCDMRWNMKQRWKHCSRERKWHI